MILPPMADSTIINTITYFKVLDLAMTINVIKLAISPNTAIGINIVAENITAPYANGRSWVLDRQNKTSLVKLEKQFESKLPALTMVPWNCYKKRPYLVE